MSGFQHLSKVLVRHAFCWNRLVPSSSQIMRNYVQAYHEYYEQDQFDNGFELLPSLDINLYTVSNEELLYKSWNIFKGALWPIRFHSKFASRLVSYQENQILYVLSFVYLIAMGNFFPKASLLK